MSKTLERSRKAALKLYGRLQADPKFTTAFPPELDIVIFAPRAASLSESSALSRRIFAEAAKLDLHMAVAELPAVFCSKQNPDVRADRSTITCLRSVLMKPEHLDWVDAIWQRLQEATGRALAGTKHSVTD